MKFPFSIAEDMVFEFEDLLKLNGLKVKTGSDLEKISITVLETNAKHKKEIIHHDKLDIREIFSDVAGLIDFISQILKHKKHKDFHKLIPHLSLLNTSGTSVLTTRSKITDDGNNKLFELYIALLCMSFSNDVDLDHPKNSKGDNPDILFEYKGETWAIACKALHANKEKTLYDAILKGTDQVNRSIAGKGFVIVNVKNVIDREAMWPLTNLNEIRDGGDPEFGSFSTLSIPLAILKSYSTDFQKRLVETIGIDNLLQLADSGKCPTGFVIFLHVLTAIEYNCMPQPTILKTLNLVQFADVRDNFTTIIRLLNESMHNKI